jgi:uncharacterized protein YjfI (DUF2170 family)
MSSFELKQIGLNRIMDWYTQIKSNQILPLPKSGTSTMALREAYLIFLSNLSKQNKLQNIIS